MVSLKFIELPPFPKKVKKLNASRILEGLKDLILRNPKVGTWVQGTGGCRKVRIALKEGKGKSSG